MSTQGLYDLLRISLSVEDMVTPQGHPSKDIKSLSGHQDLNRVTLNRHVQDVLVGDVLSAQGHPSKDIMSSAMTSSAGTSYPHRDVLNGDVLDWDIYVHFYFCLFIMGR